MYFAFVDITLLNSANLTLIDLTPTEIDELHEIDKSLHFRACTPEWTGWGNLGFPDRKFSIL